MVLYKVINTKRSCTYIHSTNHTSLVSSSVRKYREPFGVVQIRGLETAQIKPRSNSDESDSLVLVSQPYIGSYRVLNGFSKCKPMAHWIQSRTHWKIWWRLKDPGVLSMYIHTRPEVLTRYHPYQVIALNC